MDATSWLRSLRRTKNVARLARLSLCLMLSGTILTAASILAGMRWYRGTLYFRTHTSVYKEGGSAVYLSFFCLELDSGRFERFSKWCTYDAGIPIEWSKTVRARRSFQWIVYDFRARGCPFLCLRYLEADDAPYGDHRGIAVSDLDSYPRFRFHSVIWIGLVGNLAFWSAVAGLPMVTYWWIRRWRRVRRGLCTGCGYDLRGSPSDVCPECGVKSSRLGAEGVDEWYG